MIAPIFAILLWTQQASAPKPAKTSPATTHAKTAAAKTPPAPKTEADMQQDISGALHAAEFAKDQITVSFQGHDITLSGVVHVAEHKGLATTAARKAADTDHWTDYHVLNHLEVEPGQ